MRITLAMRRALMAMADGDTRVTWVWHWGQWRTIKGVVVKPMTMRALVRRQLIQPVGRTRHGHRDHQITAAGREAIA